MLKIEEKDKQILEIKSTAENERQKIDQKHAMEIKLLKQYELESKNFSQVKVKSQRDVSQEPIPNLNDSQEISVKNIALKKQIQSSARDSIKNASSNDDSSRIVTGEPA